MTRQTTNGDIGRAGEDAAARWYQDRGYRILDRNWRTRRGELDLICAGDGVVVFCEVKTRTSTRFGRGFEAVDRRKQQRIRALAADWLRDAPVRAPEIRFDVADVDGAGRVEILQGCF